jgi:hypothetical protein
MNAATCAVEIRQAARTRITELGITYETVDEIAGFPARYTGKLLAEPPMRNLSLDSMFALLGAIALTPQLEHDEKRLEKLQKRMQWAQRRREGPQYKPRMLAAAKHKPVTIYFTTDFMAQLGAMGGVARAKKLTSARRKSIARKAALVRWADVKAAARSSTAIALPKSQESARRPRSAGTGATKGQALPQ